MSSTRVAPASKESFGIEPELRGDLLSIKITGTGDMPAVEPLNLYLRFVQEQIKRLSVAVVEFDIRELYFLNSSCLKSFITFIRHVEVQDLRCKIRFVTDARLGWQRRSLAALQRLSPELVAIDDA